MPILKIGLPQVSFSRTRNRIGFLGRKVSGMLDIEVPAATRSQRKTWHLARPRVHTFDRSSGDPIFFFNVDEEVVQKERLLWHAGSHRARELVKPSTYSTTDTKAPC